MKKVISLLLAFVMCLSLCACGGEKNPIATNNDGSKPDVNTNIPNDATTQNNTNEPTDYTLCNDIKVISKEKMMSFAKSVELTNDNWTEYFYIEKVVEEIKNDFGEVVDTHNDYYLRVKIGKEFAYAWYNPNKTECEEENVLECTYTPSGDTANLYTSNFSIFSTNPLPVGEKELKIEDFEFIRSAGQLVVFEIPEEYWNTDADGKHYVYYGDVSEGWIVLGGNLVLNDGSSVFQGDCAYRGMQEMLAGFCS